MGESTEVFRTERRRSAVVGRVVLTLGLPVLLLLALGVGLRPPAVHGDGAEGTAPGNGVHANGELRVAVLVEGAWQEVGRLPYDRYPTERSLRLEGVDAEGAVWVRIAHSGETAAHVDRARLDGRAPVDVQGAGEGAGLALEKLAARDHDVVDVRGRTLILTFEAGSAPAVLSLVGRIEPARIPEAPFQFPPENTYRAVDASCAFYTYRWNSRRGALALDGALVGEGLGAPFFRELTEPGTGHPDGVAYGWVRNDDDYVYVALDFTSDNTMDGDSDYATVYVNAPGGVRAFRASEAELEWGRPGFTYTERVDYQHKVYEFAIPVAELGLGSPEDGTGVGLAFALYGTAAPPPQPFPGPLDPSFDGDGVVTTTVGDMASAEGVVVQPDGKIVVAGQADGAFAVARYNPDGGLDSGFGSGGVVTTSVGSGYARANDVVVQPDGKIVAAGYARGGGDWDFAVARYEADGDLDAGFGANGVVTTSIGSSDEQAYAVGVQADDRIVVAGYSNSGGDYDFAVMRYGSDGALDGGFGSGGVVTTPVGSDSDYGHGLAIQPNGRILVVGWSYRGLDTMLSLVRYTGAGVPDPGFGTQGIVTASIATRAKGYAVALQSGGRIVAGGSSYSPVSGNDFALVRYDGAGNLDATFGNSGVVTTAFGSSSDDRIEAMAVRPDDQIVAAGSNLGYYVAVAAYGPNGAPVDGFGVGGKANTGIGGQSGGGNGMDVQADGRVVVAGYSTLGVGDEALAVVRYGRDLGMRKTVTPTAVMPGGAVTYTLAFSNTGAGVKNVGIVDRAPVSVTVSGVVSSGVPMTTVSAGPVHGWEVGALEYGERGMITITGVVSESLAAHTFTNTATINVGRWENDVRNNSAGAGVEVVWWGVYLPLVLRE